uniref:Uncharacterized protein n=1 Tax=Euplotes harpa TaxID=151035 RepID=A0A7S3N4W3_9SPIT|mmetsp:Transcript_21855/g.25131  ORF Transcript_21855/g.25131 Transcript_21855/m.25131 type:complete len:135 (+) Transcript_21855:878-1282(+)
MLDILTAHTQVGLEFFQLKNDLLSINSKEYQNQKGVPGDDIHEGKKSLLVIHACNNVSKPKRERLIDILGMRTQDPELIKEAIDIIKSAGSIDYTLEKIDLFNKLIRRDVYNTFKKDESLMCFEASISKIGVGF